MRRILKKHSTKAERIIYEILKKHHIPFKFRWMVKGREVDFLIGNIVIEIQDHRQDTSKNKMILENGYSLLHLTNQEIYRNCEKIEKQILNWTKQLWQKQV